MELVRGHLNHVPAVVPEPRPDRPVAIGGRSAAVQVAAHPIEIDAHTLVWSMMRATVYDVRRRRADCGIEPKLLASDTFFEAGRLQQVSQPSLGLINGTRTGDRLL